MRKGTTKKSRGKLPAKRGGHAANPDNADEGEGDPVDSKVPPPRINWTTVRTERLVEWLESHVEDRQRLFSDSAQDAKEGNRRRRTAKTGKGTFHLKMAEDIFSVDEDAKIRDDLRANGAKRYAKAVENHIAR
jgi:hypothetical protein